MTLDMEKLTAYVLGELDEAERAAVEELLVGDEAAREAVAELRATASFAREALRGAEPALNPAQRVVIEAKATAERSDQGVRLPGRSRVWRWSSLAVAAAALVIVLAGVNRFYGREMASTPQYRMASRADSALSPNAQKAKQLAESLPPGSERYLVRDINNPAASAAILDRLNYEDPAVQKQIQDLSTASTSEESRKKLSEASIKVEDLGSQKEKDSRLYKRRAVVAENETIVNAPMDTDSNVEVYQSYMPSKAEPSKDSNLQNVIVGGQIMVRKNWSYESKQEGIRSIPPEANAPALQDPNKVYWPDHNTEAYAKITDNPFKDVTQEPLSTFSIDVDTASYSNVRRFLTQNTLPPPDAVRIEELLNYFDYDYAPPADKSTPFAAHVEVASCPWAPEHRLARVALKGWEMAANERPASNLVFLVDVSGSMQPENKLPLLKEGLRMLVRQLDERDRIAMVVYAGNSGLVLPSTPGNEQETILDAIGQLESGGSTHGSAGIQLAYETAVANFIPGGTNRVMLCTDGDFNVGVTDEGQLVRIIEEKAKSGVFLTVLGFGMGNVKDATLEQLADKGNGNYAYIDTLNEARKVLVQGMSGTLVTIAKDVKIQVEFNPAQVKAYRLIGYENRILAAQDFNDDTKDAGEIGAGHTVTALYELVPPGAQTPGAPSVDPLKYQQQTQPSAAAQSGDLLTLKLRYKAPDGDTSKLLEYPVRDGDTPLDAATPDFRFAASVAEFGMILRGSPHKGNSTFEGVMALAESGIGKDAYGYRTEFLQLVQQAKALTVNNASE